jgi:hypothetical protein
VTRNGSGEHGDKSQNSDLHEGLLEGGRERAERVQGEGSQHSA